MSRYQIEETEQGEFEGRYTVDGWPNVAVWVKGWEVEPDEDTEWSGCYNKTGNLVVVMVGDDKEHLVDPDDLTEMSEDEYCSCCGQVGCHWS